METRPCPGNPIVALIPKRSWAQRPGGGAWQDYALHHEMNLRSGLYAKTEAQYEHISRYPLLFARSQNNFTLAIEIGVHPGRKNR